MIWSMHTFLPHTFWDWLFYGMFKFQKLEEAVKKDGVEKEQSQTSSVATNGHAK